MILLWTVRRPCDTMDTSKFIEVQQNEQTSKGSGDHRDDLDRPTVSWYPWIPDELVGSVDNRSGHRYSVPSNFHHLQYIHLRQNNRERLTRVSNSHRPDSSTDLRKAGWDWRSSSSIVVCCVPSGSVHFLHPTHCCYCWGDLSLKLMVFLTRYL